MFWCLRKQSESYFDLKFWQRIRGGGMSQKLGAQITLKSKKWVRKTSIFITWGSESGCALCALDSLAPVLDRLKKAVSKVFQSGHRMFTLFWDKSYLKVNMWDIDLSHQTREMAKRHLVLFRIVSRLGSNRYTKLRKKYCPQWF